MEVAAEKQLAHALIDRLDASQVVIALRFLEFIAMDPVARSMVAASLDDEPLTGEEEQALAASKEWFKRNKGIPHEEVLAEFGLESKRFAVPAEKAD